MQPKYFHASRASESLDSDIRPECQRLLGIVYMYWVIQNDCGQAWQLCTKIYVATVWVG
jgi:hypothetical protein